MLRYLSLVITGLAAALVSAGVTPAYAGQCATSQFRLDSDFPAGAMAQCAVIGEDRIRVTIAPEDDPPINPSPWYAFRLNPIAPNDGGMVAVEIDYPQYAHRYWPKVSTDTEIWDRLSPESVVPLIKDDEGRTKRVLLKVQLSDIPVFIAGQELLTPEHYDEWFAKVEQHDDVRKWQVGLSAEQRAIDAITISARPGTQKEQVVLIGRQHPPELTGAIAHLVFTETLLADTELARRYRERFETIVVPMVNPDGVVHGHWRHNTGGVDLNRDWGPFTQPETRLMRDLLVGIENDPNKDLRLFLDFHSTQKDVVYTIPEEFETDPAMLVSNWLKRYQDRMPGYEVVIEAGHNADRPVSKAYIHETFGAPAATFELGDETDRKRVDRIGKEAAIAMMETLLQTEAP
ncbi:M14 family metallopeptidase [Alterisphingorhabdus coralli]|uniref:M14 family zinc carboxypeptidase n=1 Tax=Alterisphingorhabdus coralli TaxID=3071408 RepID=A0AA97F7N7_9SPHN|nr:M14 family zinc carboxypeptidase [Parasphingorhabdus sp. SCSIO 66989]WOE75894.1 M14 family zinc carboxypeptidase [Parasphingorhabdus sp. SCSIO 66989]